MLGKFSIDSFFIYFLILFYLPLFFHDSSCGPGAWLLEMSTQHPLTRFFGVDIAKVFPTEIKPTNLEFRQCDMNQGLPFADNYFDFVRMSLMLTSFRANQW